jgi:hypothetical protein
MAKANPANLNPQAPEADTTPPEIVYLGDAESKGFKFEINPQAARYVVYPTGNVLEYLK